MYKNILTAVLRKRKKQRRHDSVMFTTRNSEVLVNLDKEDDVPRSQKAIIVDPPSPRSYKTQNTFISDIEDLCSLSSSMTKQSTKLMEPKESFPKLHSRSNRRTSRLNTQLLEALENRKVLEVKRLLESGANPNATCHLSLVSACHIAALTGDHALSLLLEHGADKNRTDPLGYTPLHLAAWAGHVWHLGLLLELPKVIQNQLRHGELTPEIEKTVRNLRPHLREAGNIRCEFREPQISPEWLAGVDHNCSKMVDLLPFIQPGWTPLHAASCTAQHHCVRLLLAAGVEPCPRDVIGRTPLDVAGFGYYEQNLNMQQMLAALHPSGFAEVVSMLLNVDDECRCHSRYIFKHKYQHTPLHTAVELQIQKSIPLLLEAGVGLANLNSEGQTPLHMCVKKRLKNLLQLFIDFRGFQYPAQHIVDIRDDGGYTVLHYSVLTNWMSGVCLTLDAGANVFSMSYNGETALHSAADLGHLDILKKLLEFSIKGKAIDKTNKKGETALFKAVFKGNLECARMLLRKGASIDVTLPDKTNVFHIAAGYGLYNMLAFLLDYHYIHTKTMINNLTKEGKGYGPLHYAVEKGNIECVKLLLSRNAFINLTTNSKSTPLHIAAKTNNVAIVKLLLKNNKSAMFMQDWLGMNALHTACYFASRDVIKLLLREGADLSGYTGGIKGVRAIKMLMDNLSKPTEFINEIFDSCIKYNGFPQDQGVAVDYGILVPNKDINPSKGNEMDMEIIQALLETGNSYNQKRLLIHPLVESFLCLKWEALLPFFYIMLVLYGLFVTTLSAFILSVYFYRDTYNRTDLSINQLNTTSTGPLKEESNTYSDAANRPAWLNCTAWAYALYFTICLFVLQEILYMCVSKRYFLQLETWIKFSSIILAIILPQAVLSTKDDWPRHLSIVALLLSWLQMTFLLSRFPMWGYYIFMFMKVSTKMLEILLIYIFLVIAFTLSFMIEYHSKTPFENPWAAFVKTMVMMTSEFDYDELIDKEDFTTNTSLIIVRSLFFIFLISAVIVLMNLMVAVAVNDLNDLEVQGNIMRLEKHVEFLANLETLVNVKLFKIMLPKKLKYKLKFARTASTIYLKPFFKIPQLNFSTKVIPAHVRGALVNKGLLQKEKLYEKKKCENLENKIDRILDVVTKENLRVPKVQRCERMVGSLN